MFYTKHLFKKILKKFKKLFDLDGYHVSAPESHGSRKLKSERKNKIHFKLPSRKKDSKKKNHKKGKLKNFQYYNSVELDF